MFWKWKIRGERENTNFTLKWKSDNCVNNRHPLDSFLADLIQNSILAIFQKECIHTIQRKQAILSNIIENAVFYSCGSNFKNISFVERITTFTMLCVLWNCARAPKLLSLSFHSFCIKLKLYTNQNIVVIGTFVYVYISHVDSNILQKAISPVWYITSRHPIRILQN